jgi:hypothetical protein
VELDWKLGRTVKNRREMHIGFWWGNLKERDCLEALAVDWRIVSKSILSKQDGNSRLD